MGAPRVDTLTPPNQQTSRGASGRGVLDGAFALLGVLEQTGEAGLTRIADESGLPKATAHRLLEQLLMLGAVERRAGRYRIGARIFRLGQAWQPFPDLRTAARLPAQRVATLVRAGIAVTIPYEDGVLVVAAAIGASEEILVQRPGMRFSSRSAAGQAMAAVDPSLGVPEEYSPATWRRAVARINKSGVAMESEEIVPGVSCVAAPIHSPTGQVGAISALVEAGRRVDHIAEVLRRTAQAITTNVAMMPRPAPH